MSDIIREEARLRILEALAGQPDRRWTSVKLQGFMRDQWAIPKPHDWVVGEIAWLESMGLVTTTIAAQLVIAELLHKGVEHLQGLQFVHGIMKPDAKRSA